MQTDRRIHWFLSFSHQEKLSDESHFVDDEHNPDYDHEAFLGEDEARTFDQLTPEESKDRLRYCMNTSNVDFVYEFVP